MRQFLMALVFCCLLLCLAAGTATADWSPADGHKMHFPQLPDEDGYDVHATYPLVLADDFMCTETGWIKDIHFWGSWLHGVEGVITSFDLSIHADIPADPPSIPYSQPGELLWFRNVTDFIIRPIEGGMIEDWYDPVTGEVFFNDHTQYFQYNVFLDEPDWFAQDSGTIYWLNITAHIEDTVGTRWGWKTSLENWNDNAVWAESYGGCLGTDPVGAGTPALPAQCDYVRVEGTAMEIVDGLPPGTTIEIFPTIAVPFTNPAEYSGGSLGGNWHEFDASLDMVMTGTGDLVGFNRTISMPVHVEIHTAPRTAGNPVQTCDAVIWSLAGSLLGDPDFSEFSVQAGEAYSLPCPGNFRITQYIDPDWWVESFFDVTYQIDFAGVPGSALEGYAGSTVGTYQIEQQGDDIGWNELVQPSVEDPIDNLWWIGFGPGSDPFEMGAVGYYGDGWYFYDTSGWWNVWFYDHPFDPTRYKEALISFDVFKVDQAQPSYVEIAINYSTEWWSTVGNPEPDPRVPPLPGVPEDSAIVRVVIRAGPDIEGHVEEAITIPDYNPEWVSVDVRGYNFVIPEGMGRLTHTCLPTSQDPIPLDLAFVITGEPDEPLWDCLENPPPDKTGGGYETENNDDCSLADLAECEYAYCGDITAQDEDYWEFQVPGDTCYCVHVRVFADDTPGQYAVGGGLDPDLTVYMGDCASSIYYQDNNNGTFPDAVGNDAQYDCSIATNCHSPGELLHFRIASADGVSEGPYLLVVNCYPCTCPSPPADTVKCEPQGGLNPTHPPTYWYDVTPDGSGRCDFHVQVFDSVLANYSNWVEPTGWSHTLHKVGTEWWVSWWSPGCASAIFTTFRFSFDNPNPSTTGHWTTTTSGTSDPFTSIVDSSGYHVADPVGYGYTVHVPMDETEPPVIKWEQPPDVDPTGMDVNATFPNLLADDFQCTQTGDIVEIHVYGSWLNDIFPLQDPGQVTFTLSLHGDIPEGPHGWSIPMDPPLWLRTFQPGSFTYRLFAGGLIEGWFDPASGLYIEAGDTQIWEYVFYLDEGEFVQTGTAEEPMVYWLDVQAVPTEEAYFGWKTTPLPLNWNDDAVWSLGQDPPSDPWTEMRYIPPHIWAGESVNQAFTIYTSTPSVTGACCRGSACTQETAASCAIGGGYYVGDSWPCIPDPCCCVTMGNLDGSPDNLVTMGDLTVMIDHLFITLTPLNCWPEGNLDLSPDNLVTMGDLTVMIDHLFISLTPLPACPW